MPSSKSVAKVETDDNVVSLNPSLVRTFDTGATRDSDQGKFDYAGFLAPEVLYEFAAFMHKNRLLPDGTWRDGANWKLGMPRKQLLKSFLRHVFDLWFIEEGLSIPRPETGKIIPIEDALGGCLFNLMAIWFNEIHKNDG